MLSNSIRVHPRRITGLNAKFCTCFQVHVIIACSGLHHFLKDRGEADQLDYTGAELYGKTIGIIGLGHVGRIVAEYCNAFHMTVLGYSHKLIEMCSVEQVDLDTLFRDSDIISLHVPLTDSTRLLINAETFSKMIS